MSSPLRKERERRPLKSNAARWLVGDLGSFKPVQLTYAACDECGVEEPEDELHEGLCSGCALESGHYGTLYARGGSVVG